MTDSDTSPVHLCQVCRYCDQCGCERYGLCQEHSSTDVILASLIAQRARWEHELAEPTLTVVVVSRNHPDRRGRMHARTCREVTGAVARLNHLMANPSEIRYNVWSGWPDLYAPTDPELMSRKRCSVCKPDVEEVRKPRRPRRSKLGWPSTAGKIE